MKGVATIAGIAAFGVVSAIVLAPPASAEGAFAAIAYSPATGNWGVSWDYPTLKTALDRAMTQCANRPPKVSDCDAVVAATPDYHCIALAVDGSDWSVYAGGVGTTPGEAETDALSQVPGATIRVSFCNPAGPG